MIKHLWIIEKNYRKQLVFVLNYFSIESCYWKEPENIIPKSFARATELREKNFLDVKKKFHAYTPASLGTCTHGTSSCFSMTSLSGMEQSSSRETWALVSRSVKRSTRDAEHDPRRQVRFYTTRCEPSAMKSFTPAMSRPSLSLSPLPSPPPHRPTLLHTSRPHGFQSLFMVVLMQSCDSLRRYWLTRLLAEISSKIVRFLPQESLYLLDYMLIYIYYVNDFVRILYCFQSDIFYLPPLCNRITKLIN